MRSIRYADTAFTTLNKQFGENFVLVVTATSKETDHLHAHLKSIDSTDNIYRIYRGSLSYYLGILGHYNIVHVQCGMGATSRDASIMTINNTINDIKPKVVIMIGIAFGVNKVKQKIGDVLVSETILPYESSKIGEKIVYRSKPAYANKTLLNRFKSIRGWEYELPNGKMAKVITANILSGEKLIDQITFRDELLEAFPLADGGEMEGTGLFAACDGNAEWILIKGICDFADGKKKFNKDKNQSIAVEAAIATSMILFSSRFSFDGLKIDPLPEIEKSVSIIDPNLFGQKQVIQLPSSPEIINNIVHDIINNSNTSGNMLKQVQELVKAFLSLTEVDKIKIAKKLNLDSAKMIEIPGHARDKMIFSEIKSKGLLAELWDEVFQHIKIETNQNPFK